MPVTKEEILPPDPIEEAYTKNKMTPDWFAKGIKGLTRFKEEKELKNGGIKKLSTGKAGEVRVKGFEIAAKVKGWMTEKVEHSGSIVFESNVPEPDPLPKEEDDG